MTTLLSHSSPELSGTGWGRIAFKYGPIGLIAVGSFWWFTQNADARLDAQTLAISNLITEQHDTRALVEQHISHSHEDLERIAKGIEAMCRITARPRGLEALCEVGR